MTVGLQEFFAPLRVSRVRCTLGGVFETQQTIGGEVIRHQIGERLWEGTLTVDRAPHIAQLAVEAVIARLEDIDQRFLLFDPRARWPSHDPHGAALAGFTPTIHALPAGNRTLRIAGLPPGYELPVGTALAWQFGIEPVRHAYHRVYKQGTADGSGVTPAVEVVPAIRPGAAVGRPVQLIDAACKARIAGIVHGDAQGSISEGAVIRWRQTFL